MHNHRSMRPYMLWIPVMCWLRGPVGPWAPGPLSPDGDICWSSIYIYILDVRWGFAPPDFATPITWAKQSIYSEKTPSGGAKAKHLTLFPCPLVTVFSCLRSLDMLFSGSQFSCPSLFIVFNFLFVSLFVVLLFILLYCPLVLSEKTSSGRAKAPQLTLLSCPLVLIYIFHLS